MGSMIILSAQPVLEKLKGNTQARVKRRIDSGKTAPKLVVVLVGDDPASVIYTGRKGTAAVAAGLLHETLQFPATATPREVRSALEQLNQDTSVHGILVQRP